MNARDYQNVVNDHLLQVSGETGRSHFIFQQDTGRVRL